MTHSHALSGDIEQIWSRSEIICRDALGRNDRVYSDAIASISAVG